MVIELPVFAAAESAFRFASYAALLLKKIGVSHICFGTETENLDELLKIVSLRDNEEFNRTLRRYLNAGHGYTNAVMRTQNDFGIPRELYKPNNILAVEYLYALRNTGVIPVNVPRKESSYNDGELSGSLSSATSVRAALRRGDFSGAAKTLPENTLDIYVNSHIYNYDDMSLLLHYILKTAAKDEIRRISGVREGLENRIISASENSFAISSIIADIQTKRYNFARVGRTLLHIILGIKEEDVAVFVKYARYIQVLGFRKDSSCVLKEIEKSGLPIITNLKNAKKVLSEADMYFFDKNNECSDLYHICAGQSVRKNTDYYKTIAII